MSSCGAVNMGLMTVRLATKAVRRLAPDRELASAHVNGVAMVLRYEMAPRSYLLGLAEPYRTLGLRRFRAELANLSRVATGFAIAAEPLS
jgi:hypothetical protein